MSESPSREREEHVVLVDDADREVGIAPKLGAHRSGALHRAMSVFVTDGDGNLLLQQRAAGKYHSPRLWTNTCCGHPRPDEATIDAAARRLHEEMGIQCRLEHAGTFRYRAALDGGLVEHEIDHVFVGRWRGRPTPEPSEVEGWRWVPVETLRADLAAHPERYTAWLGPALAVVVGHPAWKAPLRG